MRTRKVCHLLRDTVDRQPIVISDCAVRLPSVSTSVLNLNEYFNEYSKKGKNCEIYCYHSKRTKQIDDAWHVDLAMNDLSILFKSSNVRIENLVLILRREAKYVVDSCLRLIRDISNLHVGRLVLKVENTELALSALSSFKPGSFRCLTIEFSEPEKEVGILYDSRIIGTEQFRQAEEIDIVKYGIIDPIHLESFFHCSKFRITLSSLSGENILQLRDALASSDNFEACHIYLSRPLNLSNIGKSLEANVSDGAPFFTCEYPCPDTDSYLDIQVRPSKVFIFCYSTLESGEDDENSNLTK
ncbi:hypothetical protein GCK72_021165 [Caenorhabditis remanei]|uniref:DUF38 domain-containing protein n=1 Tax=Caenorhabditis remanei TaxID=31234 RepID=A0A6A5GJC4_CAERE|nr:hypothetical protein GCK72_021165 [Caenorhabditis remanei]KAF1754602.1 hypothetical protein GCK72_021165 [Caenorhabditis remanei]